MNHTITHIIIWVPVLYLLTLGVQRIIICFDRHQIIHRILVSTAIFFAALGLSSIL